MAWRVDHPLARTSVHSRLIAAVAATTVLGLLFFGLAQAISRTLLARWTRGKL